MNRNTDCQWFDNKTESFFNGALPPTEQTRFESHAGECAACGYALHELRAVDPLMKDLLRYRMALAHAAVARPSRIHWGRIAVLSGAMAGAAALGLALWPSERTPVAPQVPVITGIQPYYSSDIDDTDKKKVDKRTEPEGIRETKPDKPKSLTTPLPDSPGTGTAPSAVTEEFALKDAAGQVYTLQDYRGYFFLFGVLTPAEPRSAANLERLYKAFGADIHLVAVATALPPNTTFPTLHNNNSRLMGARESDFVLVDKAGAVVLRGSLTDGDKAVQSVRAILQLKKE